MSSLGTPERDPATADHPAPALFSQEGATGGAALPLPARPAAPLRALQRLTGFKEFNILGALLLLCVFLSLTTEAFLTTGNLFGVARAFSLTAIVAIGQTLVILTGGIDLSVGSVLALAGLSTGMLLQAGWPLPLAMLAGLGVGIAFGLFNGLMVTRVGLPPFIVTLGTLSIGRGLVYVLTKGYPVTIPYDYAPFIALGQGYLWIVPIPVVIMVALTVAGVVFLNATTLGRYIYAVGGNPEAARLAGIPVDRVKLFAYVTCSTLAALAGLILVARLVSAQPSAGLGFELPVIAASVIGGTSLMGGEGTVLGAVLGAAIMGVLENGMVLLGVSTYAQQAVTGTVILLAVALDIWQKRRRGSR
ncbi:ABC transporter permease [Thermomicrobiaceae bacterium CFH 74404]|uniref:ABC transporter permease n=1 Tax=Thermalbibacter longus TaxID=2951981 RepID=A0AA41WH42_9BACT|nr:ABC transporter permease [Thermalbibacter longus]MCM8749998.1 ABC transporter permease [Thermalbibacter longus]